MTKKPLTALYQVCKLIPNNLVPKLARKHGVNKKSRPFTSWIHVVSMSYAHLGHCLSLNYVADGLNLHSGYLKSIRQCRQVETAFPMPIVSETPIWLRSCFGRRSPTSKN